MDRLPGLHAATVHEQEHAAKRRLQMCAVQLLPRGTGPRSLCSTAVCPFLLLLAEGLHLWASLALTPPLLSASRRPVPPR